MAKKKTQIQHHHLHVVLQDEHGDIQLSCGRKLAATEREDDSVYVVAATEGDSAEIFMTLDEAEDFLEIVRPLVSDAQERPFAGSLWVDTVVGGQGARLKISVADPEDYDAAVEITELHGEEQANVTVKVNRGILERYIVAALEGICDDLDDED